MTSRNQSVTPFNPGRFTDLLQENFYIRSKKLKREHLALAAWLRKKGNKKSVQLADKLDGCRKNRRCKSMSCPECSRAAQRLVTKVARRFLKAQTDPSKIVCVSIVPADGTTAPGQLSPGQLARAVRRWKEALARADVGWFVGATDWSFNEHNQNRYARHWSIHLYGLTVTNDPEELKRSLRQQFPKTASIPRPVKVTEWDGDKHALRYILKPNFWRRIGTDNATRFVKAKAKHRSCCATNKQRLRSKHKRELLLHLDEIGIQARLVMRWAQVIALAGTGPAIVIRAPKKARPR